MALSEYEQRKLDEIERALHRDDPGFAGTINFATMRRHRRLVAAAVFVVGLLVLVVGAVLAQGPPLVGVAVSVLGFLVMVAGAGLFFSGRPGPEGNSGDTAARHPGPTGRSRMENRFRRRFERPDE
jgi:hypothetical protein